VAGFDVVRHQRDVRLRIGYIGQGNGAGHSQRGRDELISQGRAYGLGVKPARARADELIESLGLAEVANRTVSTLSGGQRRRLDIAMGLIHAPELLFLDEPSTGLDPQNRANLQEQIKRLHAENGTTIVLTTHYLEEADAIADRVVVIDHGLVIADDTAAALKSGLGDLVTLGFGTAHDAKMAESAVDWLPTHATVERAGSVVTIRTRGGAEMVPQMVQDLAAADAPVRRVEVAGPTLDDVFLDLTGRSLRESNNTTDETDAHTSEGAAA
jgi:ABC-2 type transport system ATP-binding protein